MIKKIVFWILIFLGVGLFLFYTFQERLIFLNGKKVPKDYTYKFPQAFEEVNLTTKDNKTINAIHFKLENPKGVILFFHGNKGNLKRWGTIVPYLLEYNYEVFVIDYRGYGKSVGKFNEEKMYEDALLSYDFLKEKFKEENIVVYGRSLGATFAARVASKNKPKQLILEAPFYNMREAIRFYAFLIPDFLVRYKFATNEDIVNVTSPIAIFHGTKDKVTSCKNSEKLLDLIKNQPKEYIKITNGTHHNLRDFDLYQEHIKELLKK